MTVDMPGRSFAEHSDAAIALYYAFSSLAQFEALNQAVARFKANGSVPAGGQAFENFLEYADFAARAENTTKRNARRQGPGAMRAGIALQSSSI